MATAILNNPQVIYQIHNPARGIGWQDYCREPGGDMKDMSTINQWAKTQCAMLERRHGQPFRFIVEDWP